MSVIMKSTTFLFLLFFVTNTVLAQNKAEKAILGILDRQTAAWNRGDYENFMVGYWQSDSLMYIGKSGITYGYKTTLSNYRKNYPDKAAMGTLKFDILKLKPLGKKHYFIVGKWHLTRPEKGDIGGHFTLIFEKQNGEWVIVSDHSS
jgi:hypothetical protein